MFNKNKTTFAPSKKVMEREKKIQVTAEKILESKNDELLYENLVVRDTLETGRDYLNTFCAAPKSVRERQKTLKEKIKFKDSLYKEVMTEAVANIVMAGLVFDEEYIAENKASIFNTVSKISEGYLSKNDKKKYSITLLQEVSDNIRPYIDGVTESYFNGDDNNIVREHWEIGKANVFGELMIEGFYFYDTIKDSMKNTLLKEKQISEEMERLQKEENERRILSENETGRFEDFSTTFKSKIDRLSKPTPFQKLIEKVSEYSSNKTEKEILAEATILYTAMETANILKLRSYSNTNLNAAIKEVIDFNLG